VAATGAEEAGSVVAVEEEVVVDVAVVVEGVVEVKCVASFPVRKDVDLVTSVVSLMAAK